MYQLLVVQLPQDHTKGEDVCFLASRALQQNLWCHVKGRAGTVVVHLLLPPLQLHGQPKISYLRDHPSFCFWGILQKYVGRLQVPMDDAPVVKVLHTSSNMVSKLQDCKYVWPLVLLESPLSKELLQSTAFAVLLY